jgi:hypothetical protein
MSGYRHCAIEGLVNASPYFRGRLGERADGQMDGHAA